MKNNNKRNLLLAVLFSIVLMSFSFQSKFFEVAKQIEIYTTLFKELNMYYVNEINPAEITSKALKNTLKNLDPYTNYYNEQDVEAAKIRREGEYGGIGASVRNTDQSSTITAVSKGFAADKAGLKPGDIIIKINDQPIKGLSNEAVSGLLMGTPSSDISLEIFRNKTTMTFSFKREKIEVNPVPFFKMINDDTGYIVLTRFNAKTSSEVKKAYDNLKESGMKKLVFDLRSNPGGLLFEAIKISNFFLPKGSVIVSTKAKVKKWSATYKTRGTPVDLEIPIVVLVNRRSASASEIVAGALQDNDRAVIMGERSFGKGLVQRYRPLSYGTQLKVTISKYYTPSGRCIQELDYANRDSNGNVPKFSDGGVNEFRTKNGRKVYDGGGINPDIITTTKKLNKASETLLRTPALFNFVTDYVSTISSLDLDTYSFSKKDFKAFQSYLRDTDTTFVTTQEKLFRQAFESSKKNRLISKNYFQIKESLVSNKIAEISKNEMFLKGFLEDDIIERMYYKEGVYQYHLTNDNTILTAVKLLKDTTKYSALLASEE